MFNRVGLWALTHVSPRTHLSSNPHPVRSFWHSASVLLKKMEQYLEITLSMAFLMPLASRLSPKPNSRFFSSSRSGSNFSSSSGYCYCDDAYTCLATVLDIVLAVARSCACCPTDPHASPIVAFLLS